MGVPIFFTHVNTECLFALRVTALPHSSPHSGIIRAAINTWDSDMSLYVDVAIKVTSSHALIGIV